MLGILAINIAGFAGPTGATLSPHIPTPGTFGDELVFATFFLLFEGKMRAIFSSFSLPISIRSSMSKPRGMSVCTPSSAMDIRRSSVSAISVSSTVVRAMAAPLALITSESPGTMAAMLSSSPTCLAMKGAGPPTTMASVRAVARYVSQILDENHTG